MEKLLPQNVEAEVALLGSIIIDPEAICLVADTLEPSDFYRDAHRSIYTAILHLFEAHEPADFITLCNELARMEKLEDIGGEGYIDRLTDHVPTSAHVEYYATIVKKAAINRRIIHAAGQMAASAYEEGEDALAHAEELIFQISKHAAPQDFESAEDIMAAYMEDLEHLHEQRGSVIGVPTGYAAFDRTLGGLQKTDLIILASRPGMGKTSASLNIAYNAIMKYQACVGIFSLEMSKKQLIGRLLSMDSGIDSQLLRNGRLATTDDEQARESAWEHIVLSVGRLATRRLWIDDTASLSISALRSKARRLQAEHPLDLLIVDYLQLMQATHGGKRYENRVQELSEISGGLKALAKEMNVPVLALAQVSRAVESRQVKVPQLSDLRESGSLEQDADVVIFLYRDEVYNPDSLRKGEADFIIAKHRNGPVGEITLHFREQQTRFFNNHWEAEATYGS